MYDNKIKTLFLQKTKNFNADLRRALEEVLYVIAIHSHKELK